MPWYFTLDARNYPLTMYSFIDYSLLVLSSYKAFFCLLSYHFTGIIIDHTCHTSERALTFTTMSAIKLFFFPAFVSALHTINDCSTIRLPYSFSGSLRDLFPVMKIYQLQFSASSDWYESPRL